MRVRILYIALLLCLVSSVSGQLVYDTNSFIPERLFTDSTAGPVIEEAEDSAVARIDTVHKLIRDTLLIEEADSSASNPLPVGASEGLEKIQKVVSLSKIFWAVIILIFSYLVIRFLVFLVESFAERNTKYRFTLKSLTPFIKIIGWILAIFIVIQGVFQPSNQTLLAFLASSGIAVGFAAQDILKNIFGGIMILFDRPFQVGDKIQVGDHYGEVKEIGLRSTRIVTKDDSMISVPNAEVVNTAVSNSNSGEANCQVVAEIYLPIDVNTNKARQLAMEAARVSRYVFLNKPIQVMFVNEVKERRSYLKMRLKAYVSDIRYEFAFQSDMTEIVMDEMLKQGIISKEDLT